MLGSVLRSWMWALFCAWALCRIFFNPPWAWGDESGGEVLSNLQLSINPYETIRWGEYSQFKANLHTHTTESDGLFAPSRVIDMYAEAGYGVLALTDHDWYLYEKCTWPWTDYERDPETSGMLAIAGMELSYHHHMLSLFTDYKPQAYTQESALEGIASNGGVAIMCHPSLHWPSMFISPSLQIPLTAILQGVTRGEFSIETWFRTTKVGRNILIGNYIAPTSGALNLELHTDNRVRIFLQPPPAQGIAKQILVSAESELGINTRDGSWHHLVATRSGGDLSLYLDGNLAGTVGGAGASFDLEGEYLYLGRDHRTGDTTLDGALDCTRIWLRCLASNEVHALATGISPGDFGAPPRENMLVEYLYETSRGISVEAGMVTTGAVDDTAGHPDGPFHAFPTSTGGGVYSTNVFCCSLSKTNSSGYAVLFSADSLPTSLPDVAIQYYVNHFARHPHLLGVEVFSGTVPAPRRQVLDMELWDALLEELMPYRRPVWGFAVDDMHAGWHLGKGWIVIPVLRRNERHVRAALERGAYYFCTTYEYGGTGPNMGKVPRIDNIVHNAQAGTLTVQASVDGVPVPENAYVWISKGRTVYEGSTLYYRETEHVDNYVRVQITGEGGKTFTNPFGLTSNDKSVSRNVQFNTRIYPTFSWAEDITGTETNIAGFVIYRSSDGVLYEKISEEVGTLAEWQDLDADGGEYLYAVSFVYKGTTPVFSTTFVSHPRPMYKDSTGEGLPDYWKIRYGLDVLRADGDHGVDGDPDGDGSNNLQEYIAGTDPHDSSSQFSMAMDPGARCSTGALCLKPSPTRTGRRYILQRKVLTGGEWENVVDWTVPFDADSAESDSVSVAPLENQQFYRFKVGMP